MSNENLNININKELLDAIEIMISNTLKKMPYDITRSARITEVLGDNMYRVILDGVTYDIHSAFTFQKNEAVNILIKQNNMNDLCLLPK